ncbi:hypothetical protein E5F05_06675 [Deinococcus metallilatus]|uniref:Uncharacterized protein YjaZ n=1 Tax=Deinococcus metallilatus TaxID=1211322 RepID=A0AAJ5JZ90_9DEIO|nr:DUF2268 domain-containing putative Zn-dependent protease [Deinococcus metallilatus]MBB5294631.1 uncharacterized protein YjaZ [Deinococcus metallilatus]QBY07668.1 hypothetical protein E5F05_06675 [Deinococcus metallilatus]RXJ14084.1 hypothetical protein ERJ73_05510 [Deinococcus metallilatus]TLK30049.1 hypothetical protein FCS05_05825 [Deinococcus metallilatus]GMA15844.1 hypothetical protein GCM10025871_21750 [Deinococcus metallilatus]
MANVLHLMTAGGLLSPELEAGVREVAQEALTRHAARLGLDGVDVAVYMTPWTLPETGVGGYSPLPHWVQVTLTPENPYFMTRWRTEVPATLAHELHHARRWRGPGYGRTLLEALVSEGLAQHFEAEERGAPPPYAHVDSSLDTLWQRARAELYTPTYNHAAWFFGSEAANLPRWAGYALGYELVRRFLNVEGGNAMSHADAPAELFRAVWEQGKS